MKTDDTGVFVRDGIESRAAIIPAHGGGGRWARELLGTIFPAADREPGADPLPEAAPFGDAGEGWFVASSSFVVRPWVFPGGDIGSLAVRATFNDLAMNGARPRALTVGLIVEEGLSAELFHRIVDSIRGAAKADGARLALGDVKVVQRGKGDGVFVHVTALGEVETKPAPSVTRVRPGDLVLVNGDIGRHAMAIMAAREMFEFDRSITSDSRSLVAVAMRLLDADVEAHALRSLTRGGLVGALHDVAAAAGVEIALDEERIPVDPTVAAAGRFLGLDPLYLAGEGRFVAFVSPDRSREALRALRREQDGEKAVVIGRVAAGGEPRVVLHSSGRAPRVLDLLSGTMLPRIG